MYILASKMHIYSVAQARNRLADLIDAALAGEDVVVTRNGSPVVRIQPYSNSRPPISALEGALKGRLVLGNQFHGKDQESTDASDAGA